MRWPVNVDVDNWLLAGAFAFLAAMFGALIWTGYAHHARCERECAEADAALAECPRDSGWAACRFEGGHIDIVRWGR
jgi:hypothetical protein